MNTSLLICGVLLLMIVLILIGIRMWYHRPTGYHKGNELYDNRREDFLRKVRDAKNKKDKK